MSAYQQCHVYGCCSKIAMEDASLEQLDLSKYITAEKLGSMSDLEKRCCANKIRNYEMMKAIGMYPICYLVMTNSFNIRPILCCVA